MKVSFKSAKETNNTAENNVNIIYSAGKRNFPKIRWYLLLFVLFIPFISLVGKVIYEVVYISSPGIITTDKKIVNFHETGIVEKVFVKSGDEVVKDTVLLTIKRNNPTAKQQIAVFEGEAATDGETSAVLAQNVAYWEDILAKTKWLYERNSATMADVNHAHNQLLQAKQAAAGSRGRNVNALKKYVDETFEIKAGSDGRIDIVNVAAGQNFAAGEPLAIIAEDNNPYVITYIAPQDYAKVNIGKTVKVKILGSGRICEAIVEKSPVQASAVPNGISDTFYPITMKGVQVWLKFTEPLTKTENIDGLPVKVEWGFNF